MNLEELKAIKETALAEANQANTIDAIEVFVFYIYLVTESFLK